MSKVSDWLTFAENDLKTAGAALGEDVTNNACFHAQQTVEKSLKTGQNRPRFVTAYPV